MVGSCVCAAQQMSEVLTKLKAENDELTGHHNPKQKIHLHQKIKEENNVLRVKLRVRPGVWGGEVRVRGGGGRGGRRGRP